MCAEHCTCAPEKPAPQISNPELITNCPTVRTWFADQEPPAPAGIVLIEHIQPRRRWIIRCDANCHNSTADICSCLCDGKFHGLGEGTPAFDEAIRKHGLAMIAKWGSIGIDVSGLQREIDTWHLKAQ